jgi:hypothetical protein
MRGRSSQVAKFICKRPRFSPSVALSRPLLDAEFLLSIATARRGPSADLRYDLSAFVALKLQYDYTGLRRDRATRALALQAGFTF